MDNTTLKAQTFKTADDSLAYSLGVLVAQNFIQEGFGELNPDMISLGLKAGLAGDKTLLTKEECGEIVRDGSSRLKLRKYEDNRKAGEQCLAKNKTRKGVISLPNGMLYEVMVAGDGPKPKASDKVLVQYHGTLVDGEVFDSSVDRGEPIAFQLNQVIKGWTEILQLMAVGSKWKVYIPYQLAYGDRGAGANILPFSTLIFEIELLEIQ